MRFLIITCIICFITIGCKQKECIIPENTFQNMLIDLHIADGIYLNNWGKYHTHTDSLNFYNTIFKKYGYSRACFDSTLKYYIKRPKEFDLFYDKVINQLHILEGEINQVNNYYNDSSSNLFTLKSRWSLPFDSKASRIPFDIAISDSAYYSINVYAKKFDDDQSKNLRITAFFWHFDSIENKWVKELFPEISYQTGPYFKLISTSKSYPYKKKGRLRGWILNHDAQKSPFNKHIEIKLVYIEKKEGRPTPIRLK